MSRFQSSLMGLALFTLAMMITNNQGMKIKKMRTRRKMSRSMKTTVTLGNTRTAMRMTKHIKMSSSLMRLASRSMIQVRRGILRCP